MIQHIQWIVHFHFLKVLFVDHLQTAQYVVYNLTYKVKQSKAALDTQMSVDRFTVPNLQTIDVVRFSELTEM